MKKGQVRKRFISMIKKTVILEFYNLFWFLNENPFRTNQNKQQISILKKKIRFLRFKIRENMWWTRYRARKRTVTLTRPSRDEPLQFSILGGFERGFGIFISRVERSTKAEEIGLKRGDQVMNIQLIYLLTYVFLTLNDAGFWEVFFSEKWSLSYQIFFQMKI